MKIELDIDALVAAGFARMVPSAVDLPTEDVYEKHRESITLATGGLTPDDLFDAWRRNCPALPQPQKLTKKWRQKCWARLREVPDLTRWVEAMKRLNESTFAVESKSLDFDWFTRSEEQLLKVEYGKYDRNMRTSL